MSPVAPHRASGTPPGLPLPRRGLAKMHAAVWSAAALAVVVPITLLGDGAISTFRAMREGGLVMTPILLLTLACPAIVAVMGARLGRGRAGSLVAPFVISVAALLVAIAAAWLRDRGSEGGDDLPAARILTAFAEEEAALDALLLGALGGAAGLLVMLVGVTSVVSTIDRARLGARAGRAWMVSLALSFAWLFSSVGHVVSAKSAGAGLSVFIAEIFASLVVVGCAVVASRAAPALRSSKDASEARRVASALVVAAFLSALLLVLFDHAVLLAAERRAFYAMTYAPEPALRARVIEEWLVQRRVARDVETMHVLGALASFAPASFVGARRGATPFTRGALSCAALALLVAFGLFGASSSGEGRLQRIAATAP